MEMEIRLGKISIQAVAQLETLFGEGIKITSFDSERKLFNATISNTRIREKELFDLTGTSIHDLFAMIQEKNDSNKEYINEIIYKSVSELDLSTRSNNALKNAQIKLIGELASSTEKELLNIQNFAQKCLREIKDALEDLGLTIGMKFENFPNPEIIKEMEDRK